MQCGLSAGIGKEEGDVRAEGRYRKRGGGGMCGAVGRYGKRGRWGHVWLRTGMGRWVRRVISAGGAEWLVRACAVQEDG